MQHLTTLRLRTLATLLAALGLLLNFGTTASAQPVELPAELCAELDVDFSLHLTGEEAAALTVDLTLMVR